MHGAGFGKLRIRVERHLDIDQALFKLAANALKKEQLVRVVAAKGPRAIQLASETAAKAARRRNVLESQLEQLGIVER